MKNKNLLFMLMLTLGFYANTINAQCTDGDIILNGSFETGDFTDWTVMDLANPWFPQGVLCNTPLNTFGFVDITALDGNCFAGNGFDGEGPGQITHHQTVTIPANSTATLNFSFWVAYDLTFGATIDRMFEVQIQPVGGGAPLGIPYTFSAMANTFEGGTGWIPITLDLSAFAGQTVWMCFVETIPENFSGPAQLGLDGISLDIICPEPSDEVPTVGEWGLIILGLLLSITAIVGIRQKVFAVET